MLSAATQRFKKLKAFQLTEYQTALAAALIGKCNEEELKAIWAQLEKESAAITDYPDNDILFPQEKKAEKPTENKHDHHEIRIPSLFPTSTQQGINLFYQQENNKDRRCAATIFANSKDIPWPSAAKLHEQAVLLCSTTRVYAPQGDEVAYFLKGETATDKPNKNGLDLVGGGYCVKNATLFHDGETLLSTWRSFSPIFIAAPCGMPNNTNDLYLQYIEYLKHLIRTQYDLALQAGADTLIAGALGCGVFGNDPYLIAYLQILILQEPHYQKLNVQFHVLDKTGHDINYRAFDTVCTHYTHFNKHYGDLTKLPTDFDYNNFKKSFMDSLDAAHTSKPAHTSPKKADNTTPNIPLPAALSSDSTGSVDGVQLIDKLQDLFKKQINDLGLGSAKDLKNSLVIYLPISDEDKQRINEMNKHPELSIKFVGKKIAITMSGAACNDGMLATLMKKVECRNERSARILKYFTHRATDTREYFNCLSRFFRGVSRTSRLTSALQEFKRKNKSNPADENTNITLESIKTGYKHWSDVLKENKKSQPVKKQSLVH